MEIVPGLHWVEAIRDAKVYLWVEGGRAVVIDTAMPGRAGAVLRHLAGLGLGPRALSEVWLTHGHIDHMGSVAALKEASGARVVAHEADVAAVEGHGDGEMGFSSRGGPVQRAIVWAMRRAVRYRPVKVDRAVVDGDRLGAWVVVHAPGHTAGSVCFYHPERKLIVVGDAINHRGEKLGAPPPGFSVDMEQAVQSVVRIAALDFEVCCFGHGLPLLHEARQRVQELANVVASAR